MKQDNTFEKLLAYYQGEEGSITDKEREILDRWEKADDIIRKHGTGKDGVNMMMTRCGVSRAAAYRDIAAAQRFFGSMQRSEKDYWRVLIREMILETRRLAFAKNDLKAMNAAEANLIRVMGLDKDDPEMPDFSKLEKHEYTIGLPPEVLQLVQMLAQSGSINLTKIRELHALPQPQKTEDAEIIQE
jgi:hypothetical protein